MPWKKSFSEEDAIHDAMMLFWEKGLTYLLGSTLIEAVFTMRLVEKGIYSSKPSPNMTKKFVTRHWQNLRP